MKAISRWLDRFCYNHPHWGIPNLMKYIALGNVAVFIGDLLTRGGASWYISFFPELIFKGQVWRLFSFIFTPVSAGGSTLFTQMFFFILSTMFYYWMGTTLERQWGSTRFTVFYGMGVLLTVITGLVTYAAYPITSDLLGGYYYNTASMHYVNLSMFFAFATLYPDMRVYFYGIIPLKVKWLAFVDLGLFAYAIGRALGSGNWLSALLPVVALLNYLFFLWDELSDILRRGQRRAARRVDPQVVNFKKAQKEIQQQKGYLHKCSVCGITDASHPDMEFRYCSKCNGYYCYCMDHINNHTHVQ